MQQISALLSKLYCFTSEEAAGYLKKAESFPDEGLDVFLKVLQEGNVQQDEVLARNIERDDTYVKDLSRFLKKTGANLKNEYEKTESAGAEDLLKQI